MYRNRSGFCVSIPEGYNLIVVIHSNSFAMKSLRFSTCNIMSPVSNESLMSSFPIWKDFISPSHLMALARTARAMLNTHTRKICSSF